MQGMTVGNHSLTPAPHCVLKCDSSLLGWGSILDGTTLSTGGRWSESLNHINYLELKAILLGLQSLCASLHSTCIKVLSIHWAEGLVTQAQVLLRDKNQTSKGFSIPACNFDIVDGDFVQILHNGGNHWVCMS